jgi:hypothetical protein
MTSTDRILDETADESSPEKTLERRVAQYRDRVCSHIGKAVAKYLYVLETGDTAKVWLRGELLGWLEEEHFDLWHAMERAAEEPDFNDCE